VAIWRPDTPSSASWKHRVAWPARPPRRLARRDRRGQPW